jgi:hypothetical protein
MNPDGSVSVPPGTIPPILPEPAATPTNALAGGLPGSAIDHPMSNTREEYVTLSWASTRGTVSQLHVFTCDVTGRILVLSWRFPRPHLPKANVLNPSSGAQRFGPEVSNTVDLSAGELTRPRHFQNDNCSSRCGHFYCGLSVGAVCVRNAITPV